MVLRFSSSFRVRKGERFFFLQTRKDKRFSDKADIKCKFWCNKNKEEYLIQTGS